MSGRHLTLLLPGLPGVRARHPPRASGAQAVEEVALPGLRTLLSRAVARSAPGTGESPESLLFESLGLTREGADWPVAAVTAIADGATARPPGWMRADPVHLQAGLCDLSLGDPRDLDISRDEAAELCAAINEGLPGVAWRIEPLAPARWYIGLDALPALSSPPPSLAAGAAVGRLLPRGPDSGAWMRVLTEIQMLLHELPANRAREARGSPVVNSVWLWGAGRLPPRPAVAPRVRLLSDSVLARGLGRLLDLPCQALPAGAEAWLRDSPDSAGDVVYCDALHYAARLADWPAWLERLGRWETQWFEPLRCALWSGELRRLRIETGDGGACEIPASARWRWWRRTVPIPAPWSPGAAAPVRAVQDRAPTHAGRFGPREWGGGDP